jgi:hypothetical protein
MAKVPSPQLPFKGFVTDSTALAIVSVTPSEIELSVMFPA